MALPTKKQLEKRQQEAQKSLQRLQDSQQAFKNRWNELKEEKNTLLAKLRKIADAVKVHNVLHSINKIKD